jgi:uncharacterized protein YkwD
MEPRVVTRPRSCLALGGVVVLVYALAAVSASAQRTLPRARSGPLVALPSLSAQVAAAVNEVRVEHGRKPLATTTGLQEAALQHTMEMGRDGYFAHASYDGTAFWKRLRAFYPRGASSCWSVGENLVYAAPEMTAGEAVQLWLSSPEHRRNLLDPRWQQMGIAAVQVTGAGGVYGGQTVTVITNDFGDRSC